MGMMHKFGYEYRVGGECGRGHGYEVVDFMWTRRWTRSLTGR